MASWTRLSQPARPIETEGSTPASFAGLADRPQCWLRCRPQCWLRLSASRTVWARSGHKERDRQERWLRQQDAERDCDDAERHRSHGHNHNPKNKRLALPVRRKRIVRASFGPAWCCPTARSPILACHDGANSCVVTCCVRRRRSWYRRPCPTRPGSRSRRRSSPARRDQRRTARGHRGTGRGPRNRSQSA